MSIPILRAHFDGQHIVLDEPFALPLNVPLAVTIFQDTEPHELSASPEDERAEWARLAAHSLARAYGDSEPEYSVDDLR